FFSSRRRHTRSKRDWSSDVCSSDLLNGKLRFASTLPALAASGGIATTIDPVALHHYMSWHSIVPAPRTILAGIKKLPPATIQLIESDGQIRERVYWKPNYQ